MPYHVGKIADKVQFGKKKQGKHFQKMCAAEVSAESARAARCAVYLLSTETSVIGSSQTCDANCHHRIDFDNKRIPSERKSVFFLLFVCLLSITSFSIEILSQKWNFSEYL